MRTLIIIFQLLFCGLLQAQIANNTEVKDSTNIYYQAFKVFCNKSDKRTTSYLVEKNDLTTDCLPSKINNKTISQIDVVQLTKLLKNEKSIELVRIIPLRKKEKDFFVSIVVFNVSITKKQINFSNLGGLSIVYVYNAEKDVFVFKEIR